MCSPYNGILFNNRKEQNTNTCHDVDEPQERYTKWKNPGRLQDCTDMKWPEKTRLLSQKSHQQLPWAGVGAGIDHKFAQGNC